MRDHVILKITPHSFSLGWKSIAIIAATTAASHGAVEKHWGKFSPQGKIAPPIPPSRPPIITTTDPINPIHGTTVAARQHRLELSRFSWCIHGATPEWCPSVTPKHFSKCGSLCSKQKRRTPDICHLDPSGKEDIKGRINLTQLIGGNTTGEFRECPNDAKRTPSSRENKSSRSG